MRPAVGPALVTAVFLTVFALFAVGWSVYFVREFGGEAWRDAFTGRGMILAGLGIGPGWAWALQFLVCATGAVLAGTRSVAARGFAIAVATFMLVTALLPVIGYLDTDTLLKLGDLARGPALFARVEPVTEILGSVAVILLMARPGSEPPGVPGGSAYDPERAPVQPPLPLMPPSPYGYGYPAPPGPQQGPPPRGFGPPPVY
jgi:hypothetical protein